MIGRLISYIYLMDPKKFNRPSGRIRNKIGVLFFILLMMSGFGKLAAHALPSEDSFFDPVRFGGSLGLSFSDGFKPNRSLRPVRFCV